MTREKAVEIVEEKLKEENLNGIVKISNSIMGRSGELQHIYIERFPVKGNGEAIKKLKAIPEFHGGKSINIKNQFDFLGRFEIG